MTTDRTPEPETRVRLVRRHGYEAMLVSNGAFARMTGIKRVCFDCGAADPRKGSECPGRKEKA